MMTLILITITIIVFLKMMIMERFDQPQNQNEDDDDDLNIKHQQIYFWVAHSQQQGEEGKALGKMHNQSSLISIN